MRLLQCAIVAAALRAAAPSGCVEIRLFDSFHDGWNGAAWSVRAWNATAIVASGTLADGASGAAAACVAAGCYVFEATAGDYESEISWDVGGAVSGAGAGAATVAVDDDGAVEARSCTPWTPAPSAAPVAASRAPTATPAPTAAGVAAAIARGRGAVDARGFDAVLEDEVAVARGGDASVVGGTFRAAAGRRLFNVTAARLALANATLLGSDVATRAGGGAGGCVYVADGVLELVDATVRDCRSLYDGGAIYAVASVVSVLRSLVANCSAVSHGGVLFSSASSATVDATVVSDAYAADYGGVAYLENGGDFAMRGSEVLTSYAYRGAVVAASAADVVLEDSDFHDMRRPAPATRDEQKKTARDP